MLSIVCPAYNRVDLLWRCLDVLDELPAGMAEVIVVDDGSTDETPEFCRNWVAADPEHHLCVRLDVNQGAPIARNHGIAAAHGNFMMFVDSDDVPVPAGILALCQAFQRHPEIDYAYGNVVKTNEKLIPLKLNPSVGSPHQGSNWELAGYHWHTMAAIYRRDLLRKVGPWNLSLTGSQDWEYQARVKLAGRGFYVDELVGYWRQHDGERVGTKKLRPDYVESVMKACEAILLAAEKAGRADSALKRRLAIKLLVHAIEWGACNEAAHKKQCIGQALATAPRDAQVLMIGNLLKLSPVWLNRWVCQKLEQRRK